ncbi:MAG: caspase family protein, partial [Rhodobacteraceae bacterium]|nr:caspase family protein [Paracoccaceae bacterium]
MTRFHAPLALLALLAAPAAAETRALLVGVSDYTVLDADLKGPADDVRLMAGVLAARGVAPGAMVALTSDASGLDPAIATGQPTRAAILQAMAALEAGAAPGDTVVFYFSGHGAEAPDLSGDEGGGYDEILLPADAAGWKGAIGAVENAILDDELQDWAQ